MPENILYRIIGAPLFLFFSLFAISYSLLVLSGVEGLAIPIASAQTFSADLTGDGKVNIQDLIIVITNWKKTGPAGDVNKDNIVNLSDLILIIQQWTKTPTPTPTPAPTPPPAGACGQWPAGILAWVQPLAQSTGQAFYVSPSGSDSNPGTLSAPWQTIDKAFGSLQPGQIAYLRSGTYGALGTTHHFNRIGTATAPITVSGYPGDPRPILRGRYYMDGQYIRITNVVIKGPTGNVGGPGPNGEAVVLLMPGQHTEISYSEIGYGQWHSAIGPSDGALDYRLIGNYIHDSGGLNGDYTTADAQWNTSHGIYNSPSAYGLIANNIIEHNDAKGLSARHEANHVIVTGNTVTGNGRSGITFYESAHDDIIANNVIVHNGLIKNGSGITTPPTATTTANIRSMNNLLWNNGSNGTSQVSGCGANQANNCGDTGATNTNNKVADPMLVNPAVSTNSQNPDPHTDNHLKAGSPAIGYADPNYMLPFDFAGKCRDSSPDAGAFEF